MHVGAAFPTTEIGTDPRDIRAFARGVEALGYDHLTCIDHVIQSPEAPPGAEWRRYYTLDNAFHEVLVLLGFVAGATERLGLASAILILPQRQTVLAAKQIAELDLLTGGRFRAGIGIGWNAIEYEALGQDFRRRARRIEEQVALMRRLWTEETVDFEGEFDRVRGGGLNPRPVQRPVPVWFGAFAPPAVRRAGRLADGLFLNPRLAPDAEAEAQIALFREAARAAGRDPAALGLEATVFTAGRDPAEIRDACEGWRALGATHVTVRTMTAGLEGVDAHLGALEAARAAIG